MISECVLQGTSIHFLKEQGFCFQPSRFFNFDFTAINIGENSSTQFQQENCRVSGKVNCSTISYSSVILRRRLEFYYILGNTTSETTSQLSLFFAFIPRYSLWWPKNFRSIQSVSINWFFFSTDASYFKFVMLCFGGYTYQFCAIWSKTQDWLTRGERPLRDISFSTKQSDSFTDYLPWFHQRSQPWLLFQAFSSFIRLVSWEYFV